MCNFIWTTWRHCLREPDQHKILLAVVFCDDVLDTMPLTDRDRSWLRRPQQLACERVPSKVAMVTASCTKKTETWRPQGRYTCCRPCCRFILDRDDLLGPWLDLARLPVPRSGM
ncbi:hypothetical protein MAPG_10877 [Magnaporthiopsis poae ATCC 64411]|uniref:Uncharacterized protein n=1 Tax=Magnaporthiopsis poae (strain ATCC 64411 / 73-15) TaxID=644358 RepID=A0A0C4EDR8_MAGP6|nr:hypothetical protein MAPG_10877 [Magnaporthiopsis poae ATCC 64411]